MRQTDEDVPRYEKYLGEVLNTEARFAYSLEPVLVPLKEIVDMFTPEEQREIKKNTFLLSEEVDFSAISVKLTAVCKAIADSEMMTILEYV